MDASPDHRCWASQAQHQPTHNGTISNGVTMKFAKELPQGRHSATVATLCLLVYITKRAFFLDHQLSILLLLGLALFWVGIVAFLYYTPRFLKKSKFFKQYLLRPTLVIWLVAMLATVLTTTPVIFQHMSFVSPNNGGTLLFYDHLPTLPGYSSNNASAAHGADVGAMMWQHFPSIVAQERSIKEFKEFPLWNRYHSSGTSMIGQGQLMVGDPANWLTWLVGANARTFDIKFILLRIVFAASLGMSVLVITRKLIPATMVAFLAPFIGFLAFRINHPELFTLCYSPLIMLAWLKIIYVEKDKSRFGWVVFLLIANWLVLNSGTAKEAYMSIVCFNALGFINFILEKRRFGQRLWYWLLFIAMTGLCFLMIATPIWATFLHEIQNGASLYDAGGVQQLPSWQLAGFVDALYYLLANGYYLPAINVCLFAGLVLGVVGAVRAEKSEYKIAYRILASGIGLFIAIIYGIFPSSWLMSIPFIKNICHINTTFSIILIVPACILSGVGFACLEQHEKQKFIPFIVLFILVGFYFLNAYDLKTMNYKALFLYSGIFLISAAFLPWLIIRLIKSQLDVFSTSFCLLLSLLAFGNMAMFPNSVHSFASKRVFNPQKRVNLRIEPELITKLLPRINQNPQRVLGLGDVLFPGFNAVYGLEHINSPQAMFNKRYHALTEALKMPFTNWGWRMLFDDNQLVVHKNTLDLLNVGVILSSTKLDNAPDMQYIADDGMLYAYSRHDVWPRAFYVNHILSYHSLDEFVQQVKEVSIRPFVAIEHDVVKQNPLLQTMSANSHDSNITVNATDYSLTNNTTSFTVNAKSAPGIVYLGEAGKPDDFIVTVNNQTVPCLAANYAFKGVLIEKPGLYRVTVRYWPVHFTHYLEISLLGVLLWCLILFVFWMRRIKI